MYFTGLVENATHVGLVTSRWLLFVLMFESGRENYFAGINEWWNLSGLKSHLSIIAISNAIEPLFIIKFTKSLFKIFNWNGIDYGIVCSNVVFVYPLQQYEILRTVAFYVQLVFQSGLMSWEISVFSTY